MDYSIFTQISLVIGVAALISIIMRIMKQPLIMGYILTGIVVGPSVLNLVHAKDAFQSFSEIGITLLLFIIGLGLNASVIRSLGKVSILTASILLISVGFAGYGTSLALGFDQITSAVLGVALFFSSTIIILKVLSDNKELSRLYGQIAIGVILVDDVVATIALVVVAAFSSHEAFTPLTVGFLALKAIFLAGSLTALSLYVMPRISRLFAKSQELLFLFSIAWGFIVATGFQAIGFSHEVGALFAGVSLAGLPYATEMASKLKPLRDFFIVIFFVTLGETFTFGSITENIIPALILSLVVMVGKPFFVLVGLDLQRYTKLTSFKTAIHLSQISEFSIILVMFAATTGLIEQRAVTLITLVALITIGISTYLMKYDDALYRIFERPLRFMERKSTTERTQRRPLYPIILFGYHKGGHEFLKTFRDLRQRYLVVDYDPDVIDHLESQGIRHAYGDATDEEFLEEINLSRAQLVVSTMTEVRTNIALLQYLRRHNQKASFICHANNYAEVGQLYDEGASYVGLPHLIGSERISSFIKRHGIDHEALQNYRDKHLITIGKQALKG